jgi:hypothetical protein
LEFLLYIAIGAVAGALAGLFGVGGGAVIVPALLLAYSIAGIDGSIAMHLAVGTSFASIVITAISSVRAHHLRHSVRWDLFWVLLPGICFGVFLGGLIAARLSGHTLQLAFGIFLVLIALQMGLGLKPEGEGVSPKKALLGGAGVIIGGVSAFFGIGGGSLTVPFLSWGRVKMQEAVGTASACGLPLAVVGSLSYMVFGWQHPNLPQWSTGFVYWPAFFGIVISSVLFAKWGATMAHRLPAAKLKRIFAVFLFFVGLHLIVQTIF